MIDNRPYVRKRAKRSTDESREVIVLPEYDNWHTWGEHFDRLRRHYAAEREEALREQKTAGAARNADAARWWKDVAGDSLKRYRAACLMLGTCWCEPPGDSPFREPEDWPIELAGAVAEVYREARVAELRARGVCRVEDDTRLSIEGEALAITA